MIPAKQLYSCSFQKLSGNRAKQVRSIFQFFSKIFKTFTKQFDCSSLDLAMNLIKIASKFSVITIVIFCILFTDQKFLRSMLLMHKKAYGLSYPNEKFLRQFIDQAGKEMFIELDFELYYVSVMGMYIYAYICM